MQGPGISFVWSSLRAPPPGELAEALPRKDKTRATPRTVANRSLDLPAPSQCGAVMVRPLAGWARASCVSRSILVPSMLQNAGTRWFKDYERHSPRLTIAALGHMTTLVASPRRMGPGLSPG